MTHDQLGVMLNAVASGLINTLLPCSRISSRKLC
jgi:hypothetical protein